MIEIINEIDKNEWNQLIERSSVATYFQTPQCYDFYKPLHFLSEFIVGVKEDGILRGVIVGYVQKDGGKITQLLSRRAIIVGGPLIDKDISNDALQSLLNVCIKKLKKKSIYIETRNFNDYSKYIRVFEKSGFRYSNHLNFHVHTPNIEAALKQLSSTKRRDIKISLKNGAVISVTSDIADLKAFYSLLNDLYKTKIKLPLFPYEFFSNIISTPNCHLFIIKYENKVIGGSLCVELDNCALFEMFVCGLDREIKNVYPSTLATWAAIEYAAKSNIKYLDMMGAGRPTDSYGVRDFKAKFGGELVEHGRFLYVLNPLLYSIGKLGLKLLKRVK